MRITAACPEALVSASNQLAMCLAASVADGETYRLPCGWQDAEGNLYSAGADPLALVAIGGMSGPDALAAMGLVQVEEPVDG